MKSLFEEWSLSGIGNNTLLLRYSKLLSIPLLNSTLYLIQYFLLKYKQIHTLYLSNKSNKYKTMLIHEINIEGRDILIDSCLWGRNLSIFKSSQIVLDIKSVKDLKTKKLEDLYNIMWTIVTATKFTYTSRKLIESWIYQDKS